MPKRHYDNIMKTFVRDVKRVLQEQDLHIRNKFLKSPAVDGFYKDRHKGIATWSTTEPILKYLIFTELCDKYKMRQEDRAYKGSKLLDLSLFIDEENEWEPAEIGIEMKWAALTKNSRMTAGSLQCFVEDFVKIKEAMATHKYLLQFATHDPCLEIHPENIEQQLLEVYNKLSFRYFSLKGLCVEQFSILGSKEDEPVMFSLLLWKVEKAG